VARGKKRGNGEGLIRERKDGRWEARVTTGYDSEGKQTTRSVYGRTQKEVIEKLDEIRRTVSNGTYTAAKLTVRTYLDRWLEEKQRTLQVTSYDQYRRCVEDYIGPRVGSIRLDKLTPLRVQKLIGDIADGSKGKGVAMANKCRVVLYSAYKQAIRWQLVSLNPVEAVDPLPATKREMQLWTPAQASRFLDTTRPHRLYALFYLAMSAGMRRGELLGLRWSDIEGNIITVRQTYVKVRRGATFKGAKTPKGYRRIPVTPDVLGTLELHRRAQEAEAAFMGAAWATTDLVFTTETGEPIHPDTIKGLRDRLMRAAQVPKVRLHDLRHLHASIAISHGVDPKLLADRLGHARASFTLDTYTHLFEEQRERAAVSLTAFLAPSSREAAN
jgi:integrase